MRLGWLMKGLRTGVMTTRYPAAAETQPESWRGLPLLDPSACRAPEGCAECVSVCLPAAFRLEAPVERASPDRLVLDYGRCIMCGLCVPACPTGALRMAPDYELGVHAAEDLRITLSWAAAEGASDARR